MSVRPRRRESWFISRTKASSEPETARPMASAASLPDGIIRPCNRSRIVKRSPGMSPITVLPRIVRLSTSTVTMRSRSPCSAARIAVAIFVRLAGDNCR